MNEDFWHVSRKFVINIFTREEEISWRFLHKGRTIKYYSPLSNNHLLTTLISATPKIRILSRLSFLRLSFARSLETGILRGNAPWVRWQLVLASFYDPRGASSNPKIGPWSRILHGRTVWTPPATFAFDGLSWWSRCSGFCWYWWWLWNRYRTPSGVCPSSPSFYRIRGYPPSWSRSLRKTANR